jgi:hypothetical protein
MGDLLGRSWLFQDQNVNTEIYKRHQDNMDIEKFCSYAHPEIN